MKFEERWLAASNSERRKHVLLGIAQACGYAQNLNSARCYCSRELQVDYLSNDGHVYFGLLTAITPADVSDVATSPQYVPDARWDSLNNHADVAKTALGNILVLRSKLISQFLPVWICGMG